MNRIVAAVAAVLILGGAGYFIFIHGWGDGDRVSGEELRAYVEQGLTDAGATFESVTYDGGSDTVTVTALDAPNVIPFYKSFTASKLEIKGGDKRALELLFDEAKAKAAAENNKFMRVAKDLRAENVTFALDPASLAKAAASASGETGTDIEAEVNRALAGLEIGGGMESFSMEDYSVKSTGEPLVAMLQVPELTTPEALNDFMARIAKYGAAQKYGGYEIKGLSYNLKSEDGTIDAKIESLSSGGYDAGVMGRTEVGHTTLVVGGKEVEEELGGQITASMESAVVESMDVSRTLQAMEEGKMVPENPEQAPILNDWGPVFGDYKVVGVKVSVPGTGEFTLDEFYAEDVKHVAGLPLGGKGGIKNLVIPASALSDSGAKPIMDALGAEELRVNVTSESTFNDKSHVWEVSKFLIDVDKFGSLDTQFRFGGMSFLNELVGMPSNEFVSSGMMNKVLQSMTFARLQLTYKDQGAVDYMLKSSAEQAGVERSQLVQQYVAQFDAMRAQFGEIPALDDLSAALSTFLSEPKSLTLKFEPEEPVPLGQLSAVGMAAPAQLVETLGFSAEANK